MTNTTTTEFAVTRVFDAPLARVWAVETEPRYFARWFGARPGSVRTDVRTGGSWEALIALPDGSDLPLSGRYVEVVDHERLVMTIPAPGGGEAQATVTFTDLGDRTSVTFSAEAAAEACEGSREGTEQIFDKVEEILREG